MNYNGTDYREVEIQKGIDVSTSMTAYFFIYLNLVGEETAWSEMALSSENKSGSTTRSCCFVIPPRSSNAVI